MRHLGKDDSAFLMQIGIFQIIGYLIFTVASISVYANHAELFQDSFLATIYEWSWLLVGFSVGIIAAKFLIDPKLVLCIVVIACLIWAFVVM